jgi:hypothetical protein
MNSWCNIPGEETTAEGKTNEERRNKTGSPYCNLWKYAKNTKGMNK